jgi:large subunit ribosomal protein L25
MTQVRPLAVVSRERSGTGGARAARKAGLIPGVIYGGKEAPQNVAIGKRDFEVALTGGGRFTSSLFEIEIAGKKTRVVPRAVQFDPVTDRPIHFDLFRLEPGSKVSLFIPVKFVNQETSPGLKRGGVLNIVRHEVELICPADDIPSEIVADLGGLAINDSVHISAIKLPEGVKPAIQGRDFTIASIAAPSVFLDAAPAEGEAAEAAPAAKAAAPKSAPGQAPKAAPAAAKPAAKPAGKK